MRTAAQRIAAYDARMQSSLIDPTLAAKTPLAQANYAVFATEITQKQIDTVTVLDTDGIGSAVRYLYLSYSNQLYHAWKFYSGTALVAVAVILHDKYNDIGLAPATLKKIALDVYAIVIP